MSLELINQKNHKRTSIGIILLEDDTAPTGGIAHQGETLEEFIESFEELNHLAKLSSLSVDYLNEVLQQNGIRPVFPLLQHIGTAFNIGLA